IRDGHVTGVQTCALPICHTTWRIGGPARYLALPADTEDVVRALELAQERGLPWLVLGLGSNVLVKDGGFPGVVIRMGKGLDRFEIGRATCREFELVNGST